jgi:hypothetical protein
VLPFVAITLPFTTKTDSRLEPVQCIRTYVYELNFEAGARPPGGTTETLFGAVCIYLIIGFSFARLYAIIAGIRPHAFYLAPAIYPRGVPEVFDFIF